MADEFVDDSQMVEGEWPDEEGIEAAGAPQDAFADTQATVIQSAQPAPTRRTRRDRRSRLPRPPGSFATFRKILLSGILGFALGVGAMWWLIRSYHSTGDPDYGRVLEKMAVERPKVPGGNRPPVEPIVEAPPSQPEPAETTEPPEMEPETAPTPARDDVTDRAYAAAMQAARAALAAKLWDRALADFKRALGSRDTVEARAGQQAAVEGKRIETLYAEAIASARAALADNQLDAAVRYIYQAQGARPDPEAQRLLMQIQSRLDLQQQYRQAIDRAKEAMRRSSWKEAKQTYEQAAAIERTPEAVQGLEQADARLRSRRMALDALAEGVELLDRKSKPAEALASFRVGIESDDTIAELHLSLARACEQTGRHDLGIQSAIRCLALAPDGPHATPAQDLLARMVLRRHSAGSYQDLMVEGSSALADKRWEKAVGSFRRAVGLQDTEEARLGLARAGQGRKIEQGEAALAAGRFEEALKRFEEAAAIHDDAVVREAFKRVERRRGQIVADLLAQVDQSKQQGKWTDVVEALQKVLKIDPDNASAQELLPLALRNTFRFSVQPRRAVQRSRQIYAWKQEGEIRQLAYVRRTGWLLCGVAPVGKVEDTGSGMFGRGAGLITVYGPGVWGVSSGDWLWKDEKTTWTVIPPVRFTPAARSPVVVMHGLKSRVHVFDATMGREEKSIRVKTEKVAITPDGSWLAIPVGSSETWVYDLSRGGRRFKIRDGGAVGITPEGDRVLIASNRKGHCSVRVWEPGAKTALRELVSAEVGRDWKRYEVSILGVSADGKRLLTQNAPRGTVGTVRWEQWDLERPQPLQSFEAVKVTGRPRAVSADLGLVAVVPGARLMPDGSHTSIGTVELWNVTRGRRIRNLQVNGLQNILSLLFTPDDRELAALSGGRDIQAFQITVWGAPETARRRRR